MIDCSGNFNTENLTKQISSMDSKQTSFDEHEAIHALKHYLPEQAVLKDFIHQNTLHAFQKQKFFKATRSASAILGYTVSLGLREYRRLYHAGKIRKEILERVITQRKSPALIPAWTEIVLQKKFDSPPPPRIGSLRSNWKRFYQIDLDSLVHPLLFRILCSYLDQGISMWSFPAGKDGFLHSIRELERNSLISFFRRGRARKLLLETSCNMKDLLHMVVEHESLYKQYLFDQQFAHQGWSGIVSVIEDHPEMLVDHRVISLHDLIVFELLLEIDALDHTVGEDWVPLGGAITNRPVDLFEEVPESELHDVLEIWQTAYEWSYYDEVLAGIQLSAQGQTQGPRTFQGIFCIDDRECSFRRYLEKLDSKCETFATPGFFSAEFYFQPENGKAYTKVCPAPITPKYLIKAVGSSLVPEQDVHFTKRAHHLFAGWLITQTLGFWSAVKLFINIFRPSMGPATASSFRHMDRFSSLTIENKNPEDRENDLQIGFTIPEMVQRVEGLLMSIGLVRNFAPVIYMVGHGSSSVNNPHYAAYDCGACSGRPGSVNARVICYMLNHPEVRSTLRKKGVDIPETTQFMGALHDTTRDEIAFYDEDALTPSNAEAHKRNEVIFNQALDLNAKERARRFVLMDSRVPAPQAHDRVKLRSVSLFEPRPELNHATNTLCVIGRRSLTQHLFLDRRAFMNSYDYRIDPDGKYLLTIIRPAAPVCGGINLEYFFSRVDNQKLGAGTKLPHNVMGLFGVANGIDGDLRPGLPSQMIEVHDPIRLLMIVEHYPQVVLDVVQRQAETYEWFINDWINLVAVHPETRELFSFKDGKFVPYHVLTTRLEQIADVTPKIESTEDNLPVYILR